MQNTGIKYIMDNNMFCCIHEEGEWVNGDNGAVKYIGGQTRCIELDKHMSHDEFRSRVRGILNYSLHMQYLSKDLQWDATQ